MLINNKAPKSSWTVSCFRTSALIHNAARMLCKQIYDNEIQVTDNEQYYSSC